MRRGTSLALSALLLVLLLLSVFGQVWVLPVWANRTVAVFPEVEPLAVPSVIWGVIAVACWQAVAVLALWLIERARRHTFDSVAVTGMRAMIGCLLAFIALVVSAFITLNVMGYTTPGVMLGLIAGGLVALTTAVSLVLFLWTGPAARDSSR